MDGRKDLSRKIPRRNRFFFKKYNKFEITIYAIYIFVK